MKLDNRPRKLLLKGVNDEGIQTVKDWYAVSLTSRDFYGSGNAHLL